MTGKFTAAEKAAEARREVAMRNRVYARMPVGSPKQANDLKRKIAIMEEIESDYRTLVEKDRLI